MGEVFHAFDTRLERNVALKLLHAETEAASTAGNLAVSNGVARMLREARAAAALEHPNVISIYDVGEVQEPASLRGTPFLAMELIKGSSLRVFGQDRSVPYAERLRWLIDIAKALGAAHAQGLVHRDVKPENVMIRQDGVVKVLDFGIAKRSYSSVDPAQSTESRLLPMPTLTTGNVAVGTPYYMAPEQMRGDALDGRADQFSWGVMAFEILCGKGPWRMDGDALSLVAEVLSKPAEMPTGHDVPPSVAKVILKALSKSRDDRFPSMTRLLQELQEGEPGALPVASQPRLSLDETVNLGSAKTEIFQSIREAKTVPSKFPPPTVEPPRRRKATRTMAIGAALVASISILAGLYAFRARVSAAAFNAASADASAKGLEPGCAGHRACVEAHGGKPWVCRASDRTCVSVASDDCIVRFDPKDLASDDIVWLGAMMPLTGPRAGYYGKQDADALELARRDFAGVGGIPGVGEGEMRPLALVVCDSVVDVRRAATHLADIEVPSVIGIATSLKDAIDVSTNVFVPKRMLVLDVFDESPLITRTPQPSGMPRLVWRLTSSAEQGGEALAHLVSDQGEPFLRRPGGPVTTATPTKLAIVRSESTTPASVMDAFASKVRLNGKPLVENNELFKQVTFRRSAGPAENAAIAAEIAFFAPHIIAYADGQWFENAFVEAIEGAWRAPYRPLYLAYGELSNPTVRGFAGTSAERRSRFLSVELPANTDENFKFVLHYNELFEPKITPGTAPGVIYDAFYVAAYAAAAVRKPRISGVDMAQAMGRLGGDGPRVGVGPSQIFEAYEILRQGATLHVVGAGTLLDFDHAAGEIPTDFVVYCLDVDMNRRASDPIESGLRFNHRSRRLEGNLRCP